MLLFLSLFAATQALAGAAICVQPKCATDGKFVLVLPPGGQAEESACPKPIPAPGMYRVGQSAPVWKFSAASVFICDSQISFSPDGRFFLAESHYMSGHSLTLFKEGRSVKTFGSEDFGLKLIDRGSPGAEDPVYKYDGDWKLKSVDASGFSVTTTKGRVLQFNYLSRDR